MSASDGWTTKNNSIVIINPKYAYSRIINILQNRLSVIIHFGYESSFHDCFSVKRDGEDVWE